MDGSLAISTSSCGSGNLGKKSPTIPARQSDRLFIWNRSCEATPNDKESETNEAMGLGEGYLK